MSIERSSDFILQAEQHLAKATAEERRAKDEELLREAADAVASVNEAGRQHVTVSDLAMLRLAEALSRMARPSRQAP